MDSDEELICELGFEQAPNCSNGIKLKNGQAFIVCPFDSTHVIINSRMQGHLFKCRRVYTKNVENSGGILNFVNCKYNPGHILLEAERRFHEETCPCRRSRPLRRAIRVVATRPPSSPEIWDDNEDGAKLRLPSRSPTPGRRFSHSPPLLEVPSRSPSAGAHSYYPSLYTFAVASPRLSNSPKSAYAHEPDMGYGSAEPNSASADTMTSDDKFASYADELKKLPVFHRTNTLYKGQMDADESAPNDLARVVHKHVLDKSNVMSQSTLEGLNSIEKEALEDWDLQAKLFPSKKFNAMKKAEVTMQRFVAAPAGLSKVERRAWREKWSNKLPRVYDPTDPD